MACLAGAPVDGAEFTAPRRLAATEARPLEHPTSGGKLLWRPVGSRKASAESLVPESISGEAKSADEAADCATGALKSVEPKALATPEVTKIDHEVVPASHHEEVADGDDEATIADRISAHEHARIRKAHLARSSRSEARSNILRISATEDDVFGDNFESEEPVKPRPAAKRPMRSILSNTKETAQTKESEVPDMEEVPTEAPRRIERPEEPDGVHAPGTESFESGNDPGAAASFAGDTNCDRAKAICRQALSTIKRTGIDTIDINIAISGNEADDFPCECTLLGETFQPRNWECVTFNWKASGLCHKPIYFEEVALERYGHSCNPVAQPFVSAAHFFCTIPILPYKWGMNPPNECMYTLGYYRPGDCAPYLLNPLPLSLRGAMWEAGVWTGMGVVIP